RDAVAAYRHLVDEREVDPRRLVLLGESLGAAVAVELSLRERAAALVLEAPFSSIPAMARVVYPFLPFTSRLRTRYDNLAKIPRIDVPLVIIHGKRDVTVPFEQGEELFRAAREPKTFGPLEEAGHADGFLVGGDSYWSAWIRLLESLDSGRPIER
ncbi:MAG: alpha/beta hydrolase, partial [Vicinamibacteria bacterium]